jgi:hypothetical protein
MLLKALPGQVCVTVGDRKLNYLLFLVLSGVISRPVNSLHVKLSYLLGDRHMLFGYRVMVVESKGQVELDVAVL